MQKGTSCKWKVPALHPLQKAPWTSNLGNNAIDAWVMQGVLWAGLKGLKGTWIWEESGDPKVSGENSLHENSFYTFMEGRKPCEGQNLEVLYSASRLSESRKLRGGESNDSQSSSSRGPRWMIHGKLSLSPSLLSALSLSLCFFIRLPGWLGMLWIHNEFKSSSFDREHYITELTCYVFFHPSFPAATEFENTISSRFQDDFAEWKFSSSSEQ